jgi:hypothetical protein
VNHRQQGGDADRGLMIGQAADDIDRNVLFGAVQDLAARTRRRLSGERRGQAADQRAEPV